MTSSPFQPLELAFERAWSSASWRDTHVLVAVSGGADSVAMLRAALALKAVSGGNGRLFVAHLNHDLRAEAVEDAEWVQRLCDELGVPCEVGTVDVAAVANRQGDGWEAAARTARFEFLQHAAESVGARYVAVAHTADDQVETVLHRILRGAGITGLRGIKPVRWLSPSVSIVRPLLGVWRTEVIEYLSAIGQAYRTDVTNADLRWTRNRLRHELLPMLRKHFNVDVDAALLRIGVQAAEAHAVISGMAQEIAANYVTHQRAEITATGESRYARRVVIECPPFAEQPELVVREVCRRAWDDAGWHQQAMGFDEWQLLADLVLDKGRSAVLNLPGNVRAYREGTRAILELGGMP